MTIRPAVRSHRGRRWQVCAHLGSSGKVINVTAVAPARVASPAPPPPPGDCHVGLESAWHNGIMELNMTGDVRAWAKSQGFQVGDRGRLPAAVTEAYTAAANVDAATPVRRPARKVPASSRRGSAVAADPTSSPLAVPKPARRASRDTADRPKRPASVPKQPSLASVVNRVAELEAKVTALTERLDAAVTQAKPSRAFLSPRLR